MSCELELALAALQRFKPKDSPPRSIEDQWHRNKGRRPPNNHRCPYHDGLFDHKDGHRLDGIKTFVQKRIR
jgi:hypothetical protein